MLVLLFFRRLHRGQRVVDGTEGHREDRRLKRRQRAVERTEGIRGDRGP